MIQVKSHQLDVKYLKKKNAKQRLNKPTFQSDDIASKYNYAEACSGYRTCDVCTVSARDKSAWDPQSARSLELASYAVSTLGIVVTIIAISIFLAVYSTVMADRALGCRYEDDGICYNHMHCEYTIDQCAAFHGIYDDDCCYLN